MRVVVDTNVIVSQFLTPRGTLAQLIQRLLAKEFDLLLSEPILNEYRRALGYDHLRALHGMDDQTIAQAIEGFRKVAIVVAPDHPLDIIKNDPTDNKFLECAVAGGADYVISGDRHLLKLQAYEGIPILSPAAFLARIDSAT